MWFRHKQVLILSLAAILTGLIGIGGALLFRGSGRVEASGQQDPLPSLTASVEPSAAVSESPSPSPSPSAAPSKSPTPKPKSSFKPQAVPKPPPPPSKPAGCTPHYEGTNVPREQVGAALDAAAAKHFWATASPRADITLPVNLIKAVAEQESGWQSAIVSCVGAVGAMQVLPATGTWMNQRFGISFNVREVQGNAMLGSAYLQWLIKYFGDAYFGSDYTIRSADCSQDATVPDHREWCLLNAVISAYNVGHGTVDNSKAAATETNHVYFVNHAYIENVRALMSRF